MRLTNAVRPDPYGLPVGLRASLTHAHVPLLCELAAPLRLTSLSLAASHITDESVALLVEVGLACARVWAPR